MNDPFTVPINTYLLVLALAVWGGVVNFLFHLRQGRYTGGFSIYALISDIVTSGFAGLLAFWVCSETELLQGTYWTYVIVGIAGHMGSRTIALLETRLSPWLSGRRDQDPKP